MNKQIGDYLRLGKVGEGSFGKIYKGRQLGTGRLVALKKLKLHIYAQAPQFSYQKEIALHSRLDSMAHVARLLEVLEVGEKVYLVMEYFCMDLQQIINRHHSQVSPSDRACLARQMIDSVAEMHSRNVIHRDLKPSNFLVDDQLRLVVADLGISREESALAMTKYVTTKQYRPAEIFLGSSLYDRSVDIWSLGCCLATLLTGQMLFDGGTEMEILFKIFGCRGGFGDIDEPFRATMPNFLNMDGPAKDMAEVLGQESQDGLAGLIESCLQMDPRARPSIEQIQSSEFYQSLWGTEGESTLQLLLQQEEE